MIEAWVATLQRRPVGLAASIVALLGLSALSFVRLPVTLLPNLDYPALVVWTALPEAPPEHVERWVTRVLEESVAGVSGLTALDSRSRLGGSLLRLRFDWQQDLDLASLEVRRALDRATAGLPPETERPLVMRLDPSQRPFLILALTSVGEDPTAMPGDAASRVVQDVVVRRLEQVEGVARARVTGSQRRFLDVRIDVDKMTAHGLDFQHIAGVLGAANISRGGGVIRRGAYHFSLEVHGRLSGPEDVAAINVAPDDRAPILLRQVGVATWGVEEPRGTVRLNGRHVLLLSLEARPDANTVETAGEVHGVIDDLRAEIPGLVLEPIVDESLFVRSAMRSIGWAIALGGLLAVAVLRMFLAQVRALLAVAIAVPLSAAVALVFFDGLGLGLDLISLSGLGLGIGMLVDNAIVVVENIARRHELGEAPALAARRGTAEVAMAITASTLTTLAVFLPLTQVEGLAGRLFLGQALAVSCSLVASLLVGLTVVPVLLGSGKGIRTDREGALGKVQLDAFERWLGRVLGHRRSVLAAVAVFLTLGATVGLALPRRPVPEAFEPRLTARVELPAHAGAGLMAERSAVLEEQILRWPEVEAVLADLGERDDSMLDLDPRPMSRGELTVTLRESADPWVAMERVAELEIPADTAVEFRRVDHRLGALLTPSITRGDLAIDLSGESWDELEANGQALRGRLSSRPELRNVALADAARMPMYRLHLDRQRMMRYGVSAPALLDSVEAVVRGREATRLELLGEDVEVRLLASGGRGLDDLLTQRVATQEGQLPISRFVEVEAVETPWVRSRVARTSVVRLVADIADGYDLTDANGAIQEELAGLADGVRARVRGANEGFRDALWAAGKSLLLSVLLIYLILAVQFESLRQPLIILSVVPLAVGGVALALRLTGHGWNLMSLIGCVILVGIAVNDAIVKVDFANRARRQGATVEDAARRASRERLRPVLMTTATTGLGLLPLALGWGAGAELRSPLAVSVIGGLIAATALTLVVVPTLYCLLTPTASGLPKVSPGPVLQLSENEP